MADKKELKLFLTFLLLYSFFIRWEGWNENTRLDLIRAIVEEHRLTIDSYYRNTGDRSIYQGHYYSDKAPGMSFIGAPIYFALYTGYNTLVPESIRRKYAAGDEYIPGERNYAGKKNPGLLILTTMIILTLTGSSLLGAANVILVHRLLKEYIDRQPHRLIIAFAYGISATPFHTSTIYLGHAMGTFFALLPLVLVTRYMDRIDLKKMFLTGVLAGFAVTVETQTFFLSAFTMAVIIKKTRSPKTLGVFLAGLVLGALPFLAYNTLIFGNPLSLPRFHVDPAVWPSIQVNKGLAGRGILPPIRPLLGLLILPYRGLFVYNPFLLLSLAGLVIMLKKQRFQAAAITLTTLASITFLARWWMWWGGLCYGPRHITPLMPLLIIPSAFIAEKAGKKILTGFLILAAVITVLGLQDYEDTQIKPNWHLDPQYKSEFDKNMSWKNPLTGHYLPKLLENGPRSRLFENLLDEKKLPVDIRHMRYSKADYPNFDLSTKRLYLYSTKDQLVYLKTSYLAIIPAALILCIIWWGQLENHIKKKKKTIALAIAVITLLLALGLMEKNRIVYSKNWWPEDKQETHTWMSQHGEIDMMIPGEKGELLMRLRSFSQKRHVKVMLEERMIGELNVYQVPQQYSIPVEGVTPGRNRIKFTTDPECTPISEVEGGEDVRCVSIALNNLSFRQPDLPPRIEYGNYWWPTTRNEKFRWMSQNATITIQSKETQPVKTILQYRLTSSRIPRQIEIFQDNKRIDQGQVYSTPQTRFTMLNLQPGLNKIRFQSLPDCQPPNPGEDKGDKRCISIGMQNPVLIPSSEIGQIQFENNWWKKEPTEDARWMNQNATVLLINQGPTDKNIYLKVKSRSHHKDRNMTIYLNDEKVGAWPVQTTGTTIKEVLYIKQDLNRIKIEAEPGCVKISEIEGGQDVRCVSIGLEDFQIVSIDASEPVESANWWPKVKSEDVRWMSQDGQILVENQAKTVKSIHLKASGRSFMENRSINILFNKENISRTLFTSKEGEIDEVLTLKPGVNEIILKANPGCTVINDVEGGDDTRCVSIGLEKTSVERHEPFQLIRYKNIYGKNPADGYEWMSDEATFLVENDKPEKTGLLINAYMKSGSENASTTISVNGIGVWKDVITPVQDDKQVLVNLNPGTNKIEFVSTPGCRVYNSEKGCMRIAVMNITITDMNSTKPVFGENWAGKEYTPDELWYNKDKVGEKWFTKDAVVLVNNQQESDKNIQLEITGRTDEKITKTNIYVNGRYAGQVEFNNSVTVRSRIVTLKPGNNAITLTSSPGCGKTYMNLKTVEEGCIPVAVRDIDEREYDASARVMQDNWHERIPIEDVQWMSQDGRIRIVNPKPTTRSYQWTTYARSFHDDRNLSIILNDEEIKTVIVNRTGIEIREILPLTSGINIIRLHTEPGCRPVNEVEGGSDIRCLSIGLYETVFSEITRLDAALSSNWYPMAEGETVRWMSQDGEITLYQGGGEDKELTLEMTLSSNRKHRTARLEKGGEEIARLRIHEVPKQYYVTITPDMKPGKITVHAEPGCEVDADQGFGTDIRCRSIGVEDVKLYPRTVEVMKLENYWWDRGPEEELFWMSQDGEIILENNLTQEKNMILMMAGRSRNIPRNMTLSVNGKPVKTWNVKVNGNILESFIRLNPGLNTLTLHTNPGCRPVNEMEGGDDIRCTSFGFRNLWERQVSEGGEYYGGWWEKVESEDVRWMKSSGKIIVINDEKDQSRIMVTGRSFHKPREITVTVNNREAKTRVFQPDEYGELEFEAVLYPGVNVLSFDSQPRCDVVSELEGGDDIRCLGFGLNSIDFREVVADA